MSSSLAGQRVLLCVCGGIAAYKAIELVRRLREAGVDVQVAMTENAERFVGAPSLQAVSGHPVRASLWDEAAEAAMGHIELARWADRVLVAPATADMLARLAHGLADDLVSTLCLATTAPIAVAPAMNNRMWLHPATQANLATLRAREVMVIGPDDGAQACGEFGPGRLREPPEIVAALAACVGESAARVADFAGLRLLISAGPTLEDLDPVRFIGNRSSGKMGFAIAAAAARRGAEVTLVAGPVNLGTPAGVRRIDVRSARQMRDAVLDALPADIYIGTAAVADYTPRVVSAEKIKKSTTPGEESMTLELVRTPDILAEVAVHARRPRCVVGFAAETNDVERYARDKLERKRLDMIAANQVGRAGCGFESEDNALAVLTADGAQHLGPAPKTRLADGLLDLIRERLGQGGAR
ncbi:MAG: bifunctional phosphopantothenoylcysteine decarboxylase/phosphopantothenate--cysteine ligase CoaBC [Lysobacteraceae bacterium]|nr:MAG: bifunctional phosphopantothenoylcysteine decarboxylase/phosphopantothenate--cysteine ligase CoaBC [Xanthomonadaceae bacterium]